MSEQWRKFPKVELHRHLDGSVRFETILDLAKKNNLKLASNDPDKLIKKTKIFRPMNNLQEVLDCFWTHQKVLVNYEAIKRVTIENIEDAFRDEIKLIELRFAPTFISEGKKIGNDEIIEAILDGTNEGMNKYPIQVGLIHIVARTLSLEKNLQATHDILRYLNKHHKCADRIVGIDLADLETTIPPEKFLEHIKLFREKNLGVTIHTAENTDPSYAVKSIQTFSPQRLGHGINIVHDQNVINLVKEKNIHLEICPSSNYLTHCVESMTKHPIDSLYKQGVSLSVNSDDPQLMNIDLTHEYEILAKNFHYKSEDFLKMNLMGLEHSFLPIEIKSKIKKVFFK